MAIHKYVRQFSRPDRRAVFHMLEAVQYLPKHETELLLRNNLTSLIQRARQAGIDSSNIFVIPASAEGSSSGEMIDIIATIEAREAWGVTLFTGNVAALRKSLRKVTAAMVIFVDDFAGSGKQFAGAFGAWQGAVSQSTVTSIFMTVVMCPEARTKIQSLGVEPAFAILHSEQERFQSACV